jgi:preprotein translocase subunit SecG
MSTLITVLHVIVCLFLMLTVLLQSGKGGGMGGAFGGGNAATVFGGSGGSTFLRKLTAGAATIFMTTSMVLAFIASHNAADALERFGESQQKLASEKEAARAKALEGTDAGSAAVDSPSIMMPPEMDSESGSAGDIDPGNPGGGTSGSAVTPSETPIPAGATDAKPNPATPAGMSPPQPEHANPTLTAPSTGAPAATPAKPATKRTPAKPPAEQPTTPAAPSADAPAGSDPAPAASSPYTPTP